MPEDTEDDRSEASVESFLHKLTSECMYMFHFHNDIINTEWQVKACTKILYQYEYYLISNDHACVRVTFVQTEGNKRKKLSIVVSLGLIIAFRQPTTSILVMARVGSGP